MAGHREDSAARQREQRRGRRRARLVARLATAEGPVERARLALGYMIGAARRPQLDPVDVARVLDAAVRTLIAGGDELLALAAKGRVS